ncbi:hypothetical protein [Bacillus cereus]
MGASPQELNVSIYGVSIYFGSIGTGDSAGIMENPSRAARTFVFGVEGAIVPGSAR